MMIRYIAIFAWLASIPSFSTSQTLDFWIQIETHPSLTRAKKEAKDYSADIDDVGAFSIGAGWYAISIGPLGESDAEIRLIELRSTGNIPSDSFISRGTNYAKKIWPSNFPETESVMQDTLNTLALKERSELSLLTEVDETFTEAQMSEDLLSQNKKKQLQAALQSEGYYSASIDGSFGTKTRNAMRAWQNDEGVPVTGILTTNQRVHLLQKYNSILKPLGIKRVEDLKAGIAINLPTALLDFSKYSPPLVHFASRTGTVHAAYMLSKIGDQKEFKNIYKALQTLDIFPKEGERSLKSTSFEITGLGENFVTYAYAAIRDEIIKGYIVVWPLEDDARRDRLLLEMKASFEQFEGVLNSDLDNDIDENIDLLFGLDISKPEFVRSGIFVSAEGHIVTDASKIDDCRRIVIENRFEARLIKIEDSVKLALLEVGEKIVPPAIADIGMHTDRRGDLILGAGYSFGGRLSMPSVMKGRIEELKSLDGDNKYLRLAISTLPSDSGGPVLNEYGMLSGLLKAKSNEGRILPENVSHAVKPSNIVSLLNAAGQFVSYKNKGQRMSEVELARKAQDITGLVSCWKF